MRPALLLLVALVACRELLPEAQDGGPVPELHPDCEVAYGQETQAQRYNCCLSALRRGCALGDQTGCEWAWKLEQLTPETFQVYLRAHPMPRPPLPPVEFSPSRVRVMRERAAAWEVVSWIGWGVGCALLALSLVLSSWRRMSRRTKGGPR